MKVRGRSYFPFCYNIVLDQQISLAVKKHYQIRCAPQSKNSTGLHNRHFYSAAIAIQALRALGVYLGKNRYAEDSNAGRWFRN